jgi:2-dehydropantoate 2-reductase
MKILIMGSGALGCYYGGRWQKAGHDVTFVARGENLKALTESGLKILSIDGDLHLFPVRAVPHAPKESFDLIVLTVKAYDTETALRMMEPAVGEKTLILSLQNGVDNEEKIARFYGENRTVGGVAFIGAERIAPATVRHTTAGAITIGPWTPELTKQVQELAQKLTTPEVQVHFSENIRYDLWLKLMWNAAFNPTTGLAGTPAGELLKTQEGENLIRQLMKEVIAVARSEGIELPEEAIENYITVTRTGGEVRTSMLVDRERGRPLELEAISGVIVHRGNARGIPVPAQVILYTLLLTWEKNRNLQQAREKP